MGSALTAGSGLASSRPSGSVEETESPVPAISRWRFAETPGGWTPQAAAARLRILVAERGACEVRIGTNRPLLLDPCVSVVVPAGRPSSVRRLTIRVPEGISIGAPESSIGAFRESRDGDTAFSAAAGVSDWLRVLPAVQAVIGSRGDPADERCVTAFIETALGGRFSPPDEGPSRPRAAALRIRALLVDKFTHGPTLSAIGRVLNLSPFYACHVFRRYFGLSIHQFVVELRVREALTRIANGDSRFSDLSHELGFSSPSHFSETLKRRLGCSATAISRMFGSAAVTRGADGGR
ncbi:MAG TPA: AraC family transcriptional regulator [Thermoanaerobaculia bacterium]|nr:AraC family transcriptional regulator [Thermoanaerobaculia bacterium]